MAQCHVHGAKRRPVVWARVANTVTISTKNEYARKMNVIIHSGQPGSYHWVPTGQPPETLPCLLRRLLRRLLLLTPAATTAPAASTSKATITVTTATFTASVLD